ncbi:LysR family transcriptional regulator [Ideonella sp. B7]|uniref:LysR family transcriptional regulator n=1 Tax=Ideonella benzenivorans TaxID=2831643 RepID=UPI001CECDAEB|nr:LysR family transcriptional regulator [Ideonella benzenivorans]MCA6215442.1 LysR family transcriptional regulator [Ideonella benzenivorans]
MHVHARAITYFDMIRRSGSIREAARRLHVASSAVNRQLLQLEDEIGTPLFERMSTGLRLTPAGEVFSRHVITVLQDEQRLKTELEMLRGVRRGAVSVAAVEGLNADLMPAVLTQMHRRYPTIQIQVRTCGSEQAALAVIQGEADVGIGFSIRRHDSLRQCTVGRFALGAIVPPEHPIARLHRVDFATCASYPLILPAAELSMHGLLQPLIAHHKRALQVLLETSSIELAKSLVERGVGLFFQSRLGLERELREGRLVHVPLDTPTPLCSELGVYVRAGRTPPAALDAFNRIVAEAIEWREDEESVALRQQRSGASGTTIEHIDPLNAPPEDRHLT